MMLLLQSQPSQQLLPGYQLSQGNLGQSGYQSFASEPPEHSNAQQIQQQSPLLRFEDRSSDTKQSSYSAEDLQHLLPDQQSGGYLPSSHARLQNKRQLSDLNHNKAITKQLVSACHYQQVLDCVAQSAPIFDEVNVATALHRLARLQPPATNNRTGFIIQSKEFQLLVRAIKLHLPRFEAQAISNTMWAFATLSYFPQDNLLNELANKAVSIMPSFRPQAVSNTLWAFAKLGYLPPQFLLQSVASQMLQDLPKSVPQDISNTLWAFATLRHHPGQELLDASSQQALSMFHKFKPQEIANLLWSFATMDYNPPSPLLDAMAVQMIARIQSFRPQAVSNSLWAYAKIGYNPGIMLLDVTALKVAAMFHQYTSQEVANTLWALAALDHYPGAEMLNAAAIQFAKRLEHFTPQDIASTLWAFAKLEHDTCRGLLPGVAMHVLKLWTRFTPTAIITILESLALLQGCPLHLWTQLLAKLFSLPASSLTPDNLWHLYHMFLLLEAQGPSLGTASFRECFPADLLDPACLTWMNKVQKKGRIDALHQDVSQHLWALGVAHSNDEIVADGQLHVDCLITGTTIVVIIESVTDFTAGCRSKLGASAAKPLILGGQGFRVVSIPYYEWGQLVYPDMKVAYLLQKLQSAQAQSSLGAQFTQSSEGLTNAGQGFPGLTTQELRGPSLAPEGHVLQSQVSRLQGDPHPQFLNLYEQQALTMAPSMPHQQQQSIAQLSKAISSLPLQQNSTSMLTAQLNLPAASGQGYGGSAVHSLGRSLDSTTDGVGSSCEQFSIEGTLSERQEKAKTGSSSSLTAQMEKLNTGS